MDKWKIENNMLTKVFSFDNFMEAIDFVNKIVPLAEKLNHHPDVEIFSYKKVKIKLTTHDKGEVTEIDHELANQIDRI